jgi:integrase
MKVKGIVFKRRLTRGRISWCYSIELPNDEQVKRKRIFKSGFERKGDAEDELAKKLRELDDGTDVKPSPQTLGEFLEEWLTEHAERNCAGKTAERYRQLAQYAIAAHGTVALQDVSTLMLDRFYGRLRDGKGKSGKPLSSRTVRHVHDTLRAALNHALRWRLLKVNPALPCRLPKIEKKEARVVEEAQLQALIDEARGDGWMYPLLVLDSATGLRRGELCALRWSDVDLEKPALENEWQAGLTVRQSLEQTKAGLRLKTPKNGKPRRLTLPAAAVDALKAHKRAQGRNRRLFGEGYRADLDLVFASPAGDYLKPNTVSPAVSALTAKVGLKGIGLHSLRHTHGSQLLAAGVSLPAVSKRLGHSSVAVTAAIYAHAFTADEIAAAEAWEKKIGANLRRESRPHLQIVARKTS